MTFKLDRWPWGTTGNLFYARASFVHHFVAICEFKLELQSGNPQFCLKWRFLFNCVTFKLDGRLWKTIGHLFYDTLSLVHHYNAIGKFKLTLQSGNAQFGSKIDCLYSRVTLKFYRWPWKTIGHLFYATSSFVHHFVAIGEIKLKSQPGNAQFGSKSTILWAVWPSNLTDDLENNRASILCYFKLCASFRSHWWIQTRVAVRKPQIWVKFDDF